MRKLWKIFIAFGIVLISTFAIHTQTSQQKQKDPCKELRFLALGGEAPTVSATDVKNLPHCFDGKFIRLFGVYRAAFENSDLYDPTGNGRTWLSYSPFYSAVKKCSSPQALKLLDRESGGTFGLIAMGVFKSGGGFGHMNGWESEFQLICVEEVKDFSKSGVLFQYQEPKVQKQILDWYAKEKQGIGR
jgi:hypothetical protein